jgi:hypothetical protein
MPSFIEKMAVLQQGGPALNYIFEEVIGGTRSMGRWSGVLEIFRRGFAVFVFKYFCKVG